MSIYLIKGLRLSSRTSQHRGFRLNQIEIDAYAVFFSISLMLFLLPHTNYRGGHEVGGIFF